MTLTSRVMQYVVAIIVVLAATLLTDVAWIWMSPSPSVLFFPAVMIAATYGGVGPGLIATALSAAAVAYFFSPPYWSFKMLGADVVRLLAFVGSTLLITSIANARRRAEDARRRASARSEELYEALQASFERESRKEANRQNERLKAVLLDALTHNLRTPLTAIKAAVTALRYERVQDVPEARGELLEVIEQEVDRLDRFVGGLGAPTMPTQVQPVAIVDLLQAVRDKAQTITRDHRFEMEVSTNASIEVDKTSMVEALYMVIENATKYSPRQTTIRVIGERLDAHHVQVTIIDEGPGIPPSLRERVFDRFFRITHPSESSAPGSGLGLSIARQLVATQGGQISIVDPQSGVGTTVVITLPTVTPLDPPPR